MKNEPTSHNPTAVLNEQTFEGFSVPMMSEALFRKFSELIYEQTGIQLVSGKRTMVSARLSKRVRALNFKDFRQYYEFIQSDKGREQELTPLVDAITTNKTEFFREKYHFDILANRVLPELASRRRYDAQSPFTVWSAGCSTGEEPYTLSMVLAEAFGGRLDHYQILATDISQRVLKHARTAVYDDEVVAPVPAFMRYKYMLVGKGSKRGSFRVVPEIRERVQFSYFNLMEPTTPFRQTLDVIFCRNVIIYFDVPTKIALLKRFYSALKPGGYLFIGHSETLTNISQAFKLVGQTVYRKPDATLSRS